MARFEMGEVTEQTAIPAALRYPSPAPNAGAPRPGFSSRIAPPRTVPRAPTLQQASAPPVRRPKATPAPIEERGDLLPFLRPQAPAAMVVAPAAQPPAAQPQRPSQIHLVVTPGENGAPAQMTAAAVYTTPNGGTHMAVQQMTAAPAAAPMPVVHDLPSAAVQSTPWAAYEKLGLGEQALAKVHQKTSKLVVSAYRLLGFGILTLIVLLLVGYITESVFYFVSDSWVQPMVVSAGDDKMVALSAQLAAQQNTRDRIASDLAQAEAGIARQREFQAQFMATVKADLAGRKVVLGKLRTIAGQYARAGAAVTGTNATYAAAERARMQKEYAAGLIDRRAMLAGNFQGAQITTSSLGIAEKRVETEARADELETQVSSLEAILADQDASGVLSYEILKIKQEYDNSKLEMTKAIALRDSLKSSLERQDEIVKGLAGSSYLRALKDHASVAFVPYGNMKGVTAGGSLYGCKLGMVVCHKVGSVIEILPGEIQQKHPHRDKMLRGQLVEVSIEDGAAAQDDVLFVGGKPMLF